MSLWNRGRPPRDAAPRRVPGGFPPVPGLVNELLSAQHEYRLNALLKRLRAYDLVICDEFGYIPFSTEGAQLLFQFFETPTNRMRGCLPLRSSVS